MEDYRFQVNLGGMIEILSDHLYSSPDVYIRELLQNAVDAITGRKKAEPSHEGQILITVEENKGLTFADNGQGLTEAEIHQFLAIIGESSKRGAQTDSIQSDYIGRFGIGLLSCFMVADEIQMLTRSSHKKSAPVLEWCGKPDGTYTIAQADDALLPEAGTKVILRAKEGMEHYFSRKKIAELLTYYGALLPFPIVLIQDGAQEQLNPVYLPWDGRATNQQELLLFGKLMFHEEFFDCIPFHTQAGHVSGVAYIRNYSVTPAAKPGHRIYLKHMLLTEKGENLIPDWAVFTRCILNADDLRPTASREGFYTDAVLAEAHDEIEDQLIAYIVKLAETQPANFQRFFRMHNLTLISLALTNKKLFCTLIDYFEFETTRGRMSGYELRTSGETLRYTPQQEKYKQLSQLFFAQNELLINASYVHAVELLLGLGALCGLEVSQVEDCDVKHLMREPSVEEQEEGFEFLDSANRILKAYDCRAELKSFSPRNLPTFYLLDEQALLARQIQSSMQLSSPIFQNMLGAFAQEQKAVATLYFNVDNPTVKKMMVLDESDLKIFVELLYVQALQIGGFPLHQKESGVLNRNIIALIERNLQTETER